MEENHSFEDVDGHMPYLNSLAAQNTLLTSSYANSHYSIPNYFWLTTGQYVTDNDDTLATFDVDNIVRHLTAAGKTWKAYEEGLPYAGYIGYNLPDGCTPGNCIYVKRHDPFPYFSDVVNSTTLAMNIVPFSQLATDIADGTLPNYAFITPSLPDDEHDGTLAAADTWLQTNIAALLASPPFQRGGDGILIITSDEGNFTDCRPLASCPPLPENQSGGRIYTVVIGPGVKHGYKFGTTTTHAAILRLIEQALCITGTGYLGAAASAPDMAEVFPPTLQITSPGATSSSPVTTSAVFKNGGTPQYMKLWVDGVSKYVVFKTTKLNYSLSLSPGKHRILVQAYTGTMYSAVEYVTVP